MRPGGGCTRSHAPGGEPMRPHTRPRAKEAGSHATRAGEGVHALGGCHACATSALTQSLTLTCLSVDFDQEGHIKRDCPKYKAQDQSSDTAATVVMAMDESDVLLAVSEDEKSDWVLDSGSVYHLCRDREVFSTYAACERRIWMANNTSIKVVGRGSVQFRMAEERSVTLTEVGHVPNLRKNLISIGMLDSKECNFNASRGTLRVSKGNKEMLWGKKIGGLYRLEGSVQTGRATIRHGSSGISEKENGQGKQSLHSGTQNKHRGTWRIRSGIRAQGDALEYVQKSGQTRVVQPVQDVHREAQRKETKSIFKKLYSEGCNDAEASLFCSQFDQWQCSLQLCPQRSRDGATTTRKVMYFTSHPSGE
ncbi:hypothetical protein Acr_26g0001620 [Actinidia rufa]|uniref:Retrovirus-related Pol polyprotein from transposon TNT 1-94-like beta-barrel domain-containing protein n=1 Tax=Actinidia rufa TaxID=165716 RepID=A0A7J0H1G4_9ERIC|nr:hypothetical protein Acr_26g0001620 [Actinidia rufa]